MSLLVSSTSMRPCCDFFLRQQREQKDRFNILKESPSNYENLLNLLIIATNDGSNNEQYQTYARGHMEHMEDDLSTSGVPIQDGIKILLNESFNIGYSEISLYDRTCVIQNILSDVKAIADTLLPQVMEGIKLARENGEEKVLLSYQNILFKLVPYLFKPRLDSENPLDQEIIRETTDYQQTAPTHLMHSARVDAFTKIMGILESYGLQYDLIQTKQDELENIRGQLIELYYSKGFNEELLKLESNFESRDKELVTLKSISLAQILEQNKVILTDLYHELDCVKEPMERLSGVESRLKTIQFLFQVYRIDRHIKGCLIVNIPKKVKQRLDIVDAIQKRECIILDAATKTCIQEMVNYYKQQIRDTASILEIQPSEQESSNECNLWQEDIKTCLEVDCAQIIDSFLCSEFSLKELRLNLKHLSHTLKQILEEDGFSFIEQKRSLQEVVKVLEECRMALRSDEGATTRYSNEHLRQWFISEVKTPLEQLVSSSVAGGTVADDAINELDNLLSSMGLVD